MSNSRTLLLASAALCAVASTALAAGPAPAPFGAPSAWTGFNVGLQGGYGWAGENDDLSFTQFTYNADHFTANGPFGGAHIGYDQQLGSLVIGGRVELDGSGLNGSTSTTAPLNSSCEGCTVTLAFHNTWQAFLLAHAGVAFDRWLIYVTGGLALGDDRESSTVTGGTPSSGSQTQTLTGGAIGLGTEYAFDAHWRFGAEWRYVTFPKSSGFSVSGVPYKAGFNENLALVSLSYGF